MKTTAILSVLVISVLLAGCSGGDAGDAGAPVTKGPTTAGSEAGAPKGGKGAGKGMDPNNISLPPTGGNANFGAKTGGGK